MVDRFDIIQFEFMQNLLIYRWVFWDLVSKTGKRKTDLCAEAGIVHAQHAGMAELGKYGDEFV